MSCSVYAHRTLQALRQEHHVDGGQAEAHASAWCSAFVGSEPSEVEVLPLVTSHSSRKAEDTLNDTLSRSSPV